MTFKISGNFWFSLILLTASVTTSVAQAGGIMLGGTRLIYPANQKQVSMQVRNTSDASSFLVQSWIEEANGTKSQDFVVTPPMYVSGPGKENVLRVMYVGQAVNPEKETLYYLNTKAIPSLDKNKLDGKNVLMVAAVTRIKLFVRPQGLKPSVIDAPSFLQVTRQGDKVKVHNPTPYHITLAQIRIGGSNIPDIMINPQDNAEFPYRANTGNEFKFRTIDDYGALTPVRSVTF
ncbi:fimbria/pilus periplasmic chaperone [Leclercia sp. UBA5958]|uniref:fimbria/pilus periplasmic chaperone n=1 Tax=Leclercia sp. UBA5958 TaxID=1946742 RepID=UPI0025806ED0|nr:fimbria/pilus periplasmic chaperone [Leclercia sp. UBA5958]